MREILKLLWFCHFRWFFKPRNVASRNVTSFCRRIPHNRYKQGFLKDRQSCCGFRDKKCMSCFIYFLNFLLIFWRMRKEGNARKKLFINRDARRRQLENRWWIHLPEGQISRSLWTLQPFAQIYLSRLCFYLIFFLYKTLQPTAFKERRFVSFNILAGFEQALRFCLLSKRATSFFSLLTNAVDFSRYRRPFVKYPLLVIERQY